MRCRFTRIFIGPVNTRPGTISRTNSCLRTKTRREWHDTKSSYVFRYALHLRPTPKGSFDKKDNNDII